MQSITSASSIVTAAEWVQNTLLGSVATVIAVLAVAALGIMMLTGRIDWRSGARVVLGCFIVFGAAQIVTGLRGAIGEPSSAAAMLVEPPPLPSAPKPVATAFDPYAGASVNRGN